MVRQQSIERGLHTRQLRGRMLPQVAAVAQLLRLDAHDDPSALIDQVIELLVRADVQALELREELPQIADCRVAEHLGSAIFLTGQPFGQVPDQPGQFVDERRLGNRTASSKRACTRWHSARYSAGFNSRR